MPLHFVSSKKITFSIRRRGTTTVGTVTKEEFFLALGTRTAPMWKEVTYSTAVRNGFTATGLSPGLCLWSFILNMHWEIYMGMMVYPSWTQVDSISRVRKCWVNCKGRSSWRPVEQRPFSSFSPFYTQVCIPHTYELNPRHQILSRGICFHANITCGLKKLEEIAWSSLCGLLWKCWPPFIEATRDRFKPPEN